MRSDSHDDVAQGGSEPDRGHQSAGPTRRFEDRDGSRWEVAWRPAGAQESHAPHGVYVFRAADAPEEYRVAATSPAGERLARMTLADVRQLLALARSNLLED